MNRFSRFLALGLLLVCVASCQEQKAGTRVCAYNMEWLSEEAHPERIGRLKTIIRQINPDILAMEEVQSRAAVEQLFDSSWDIAIKDDLAEYQEPALAVKKPYKIEDYDTVFKDASLDVAFPGGRDVLRVVVVSPSGSRTAFYVLHMKSRSGGRLATDPQRKMAAGLLAAYLCNKTNENAVVLGDLNDCPDDESVNILETGNVRAKAGRYKVENPLLVNLSEAMYDLDMVTHGLIDLFRGAPPSPVVPGSKEENERWRGKDYDFVNDSKIHQTLLDQILVSPALAANKPEIKVHTSRECFEGKRGRTLRDDNGVATYTEKGTRASDHVPIYVDLKL